MAALFFALFFLAIYPYVLFPLLMIMLSRIAGKAWQRSDSTPLISVIISVYNEEGVIAEKIENSLNLLYPAELLEIIIVSDGSTDRTNQIVSSFSDPRIKMADFSDRKGKTACLNQVVPDAKGDIIVFTDANSMFPADALLKFASNFASAEIGLVTGWTKYRQPGGDEESVGLYGRLEMVTKRAESLVSSCVGADGAVFAIRKNLYRPLQDYDINDFVIPLNVIGQGKRVVLDQELFCIEQPGDDEAKEFRRQVRITNRTLGAISRNIQFLNPFNFGSFAFFLISHKVVRFLVPFSFLGTLFTALLLANDSLSFSLFLAAQLAFICFGLAGILKLSNSRLIQLCSFFLLTIAAQLIGWIRWATGKADTMWKPERVISPRKSNVKTSSYKKYLAVSLLFIIIVGILIILCVPVMEKFVVIDRPLTHADAVVVMAGDKSIRLPAAASLYRDKRAHTILLTNDGNFSSWSNEKQRNLYEVEWAEQSLIKMGVPEKAIVKLPHTTSGSIHDALNTTEYVLTNGIKSIIIVTSDYHSRRSLWTFEQVYRNQPLVIGVYPARSCMVMLPYAIKSKFLVVEMTKYLYYRLKYSSISMNG